MKTLKIEQKHIPAIILAVTCVIIAILCGVKAVKEIKYRQNLPESSIISLGDALIIADGGNGTEIPKNTIYAVDDLVSKQFSAIKIDARLTKDNKYVAIADEDISVITDGEGSVSDYNYYDLLNFNIKDFKPLENPVIELVTTVASYADSYSVSPVIYLHDFNKTAVKKLLKEVSAEGINVYAYASDNLKELQYIRKLDSGIRLIYQVDEITDEIIMSCKEINNLSICFSTEARDISVYIEKMNIEEIEFLCYGVKTLGDIEEFYKIGVRHFITDTVKAG